MNRLLLITAFLVSLNVLAGVADGVGGIERPGLFEEEMSIYGYIVSFTNINLYENVAEISDSNVGESVYLRLKGDWRPEKDVAFHLEAAYSADFGNMNSVARMADYSLLPALPSPNPDRLFPADDVAFRPVTTIP